MFQYRDMQLDFGFARVESPRRTVPVRPALSRSGRAQQLEFFGVDRLQQHTFFFAILADQAVIEAIGAVGDDLARRRGLATRFADGSKLHMSLFCLMKQGALPPSVEAEQAAIDAARFVRLEPFEVTLDRVVTFGRPAGIDGAKRPVVLTGAGDAGIRALHRGLFQVLERARIVGGRLRAFTPHMTLFYDDGAAVDEAVPRVAWTVREFHLIHSLHGKSQYRTVATFPLRG